MSSFILNAFKAPVSAQHEFVSSNIHIRPELITECLLKVPNFCLSSNRILFLPRKEDCFHITLFILRSLSSKLKRLNKRVIYFATPDRHLAVTEFIRKNSGLNTACISSTVNENDLCSLANDNYVLIINCQLTNSLISFLYKCISSGELLIFDDCVSELCEYSIKHLQMNSIIKDNSCKILGFTSSLIECNLKPESIYSYLIHLEKLYNGPIIACMDSFITKKFVRGIKIKIAKFMEPNADLISLNVRKQMESLINYSQSIISQFKCDDNHLMKKELDLIFEDLKDIMEYGSYPTFIFTLICRIRIEKIRIRYWRSLFVPIILSLVTNLNIISSSLKSDILEAGPMESILIIKEKCSGKLQKLISLCLRMDYRQCWIIIVNTVHAAQFLAYFLQNVCSYFKDEFGHVKSCHLYDDEILEYLTDREKVFKRKRLETNLKNFRVGDCNLLVLSWNDLIDTISINADWIIYLDLPPDFKSYFTTWKYCNPSDTKLIFFMEEATDEKLESQFDPYVEFNSNMKQVLMKKNYLNQTYYAETYQHTLRDASVHTIDISHVITKENKEANLSNSIGIITRFFNHLPQEAFSPLKPHWKIMRHRDVAVCELQFPWQSSLKSVNQAVSLKDIKILKSLTALRAVKVLYNDKLLNENFLPNVRKINLDLVNNKELYPHWKSDEDGKKTGSAEIRKIVPLIFPKWFCGIGNTNTSVYYVHVIHTKPNFALPENRNERSLFELLKSKTNFGIVTINPLPKICEFPVYMDIGKVHISIEANAFNVKLTDKEIEHLKCCHKFVFLEVIMAVKRFLVADHSETDNFYLIAPLTFADDKNFHIDWNVVEKLSKKQDITEPSLEDRVNTDYYKNDYIGKVVVPWYRVLPTRYYIVTEVIKDKTPLNWFSTNEYGSFAEYYASKYEIEVKQPKQPLLRATSISCTLNCMRPIATNPGVRRRRGENPETIIGEILLPEFCVVENFPAIYWYKAVPLLSIMHRLHYILMAETIRIQIAFNSIDPELSMSLQSERDTLEADPNCISDLDDMTKPVLAISDILKIVKTAKRMRSYPWGDEQIPHDIDHNLESICSLGIFVYHEFMTRRNVEANCPDIVDKVVDVKINPKLKFVDLKSDNLVAPKQTDILKAITSSESSDIVDLLPFKLAGDAWLKFASTFYFCKMYPQLNIFQLSFLRRKLIGKRNLFYCSSKLRLSSIVKVLNFSKEDDWNYSQFGIPCFLKKIFENPVLKPESIFNMEIPSCEQFSGTLGPDTRNRIQEKLLDHHGGLSCPSKNVLNKDSTDPSDNSNHVLVYFKKQSVVDKTVVDSVRALTGVYIMNCGIEGGLKFLKFLDILHPNFSVEDLLLSNSIFTSQNGCVFDRVDELTKIIGYRFKCNKLPILVFTHYSSMSVSSIGCNQKLAFLGDSVLDLLITGFIFENSGSLIFSEIEDLRAALVNDVLYSVLMVRNDLHKFMVIDSVPLLEKIDEFVSRQIRVKHKFVADNLLFLVEETSHRITKSVDTPRALSDAFKALMAAIFLDTAGDLSTVWTVAYNIMKTEIDSFTSEIPKNPVKFLAETDIPIEYEKPEIYVGDANLVAVNMKVHIDQNTRNFFGIGANKHDAKRIAAKIGLKKLSKEFIL